MEPSIIIICVNYENTKEIENFLSNLSDKMSPSVKVLIVDNSERDVLKSQNFKKFSWATFLSAGGNRGYWGAFVFGLSYLEKMETGFEWVILSNPDISFDNQFFERLLELRDNNSLEKEPKIFGPSIVSGLSGRDQNPYLVARPSARKMYFYSLIFSNYLSYFLYELASRWKKAIRARNSRVSAVRNQMTIYAPHGSLVIFNSRATEILCEADLAFAPFLFCEEIFLGEQCLKNCISILYQPQLKAIHQESTTMRKMPSGKIARYKANANRLIYQKYFSNVGSKQ